MVMHTGTLIDAKTPNEVIGVIAHETGHLAGGHLENLRNQIARAQAIGAGGRAARHGRHGGRRLCRLGEPRRRWAAPPLTMGEGVAVRTLLSYKRAQELAADRAALSYLSATHQSAKGMVTTFSASPTSSSCLRNIPTPTRSRIRCRATASTSSRRMRATSPYWDATDDPGLQLRHDMMRAKLVAFTQGRYGGGTAISALGRQPARPICARDCRLPHRRHARRRFAQSTRSSRGVPNYAYFHELKGQILLEAGKAREAIGPLRQAVSLAPHPGLIRIMLGGAELAAGDAGLLDDAVADLRSRARARSRSPRSATASSPWPTSSRARWRRPSSPAPRGR